MEKIAILTWCNEGINYGQVLQAYAMQRIVKKMGYEPLTIRYRKPSYEENVKFMRSPIIKKGYETYRGFKKAGIESWKVKMKFNKFVYRYIKQSIPCYTKEEVEDEINKNNCSILLCGSDQIWNPIAFDPVYYLDFGSEDMFRIAYSPSIAEDNLTSQNRHIFEKMIDLINRIDYVSVREESGVQILNQLTKKEIYHLLDPTFLISRRGWEHITSKRLIKGDYIFCYVIGDIKQHRDNLVYISRKYNTSNIVYLSLENNIASKFETFLSNVGPEDFLSLIKYAKAIYTDSFHGVAISINFNKEFYACKRFEISDYNKHSRINNILNVFSLQEHYIEETFQIKKCNPIDYNEINNIIGKERKKAFHFLKKALSEKREQKSD